MKKKLTRNSSMPMFEMEPPTEHLFDVEVLHQVCKYTIHIGDITGSNIFIQIGDQLKKDSTEHDLLELVINSDGGELDNSIPFIHTIRNYFKGRTTSIIDSRAYSMGALFYFCADTKIIHEFSSLMLHTSLSVIQAQAKTSSIASEMSFFTKTFWNLLKNICKDYLTEKDFALLEVGQDLYFDAEEICKRGWADFVIIEGGHQLKAEEYLEYLKGNLVIVNEDDSIEDEILDF